MLTLLSLLFFKMIQLFKACWTFLSEVPKFTKYLKRTNDTLEKKSENLKSHCLKKAFPRGDRNTCQFLWHNICKKILTIWKTQYCMQQSLTILYKFLTSQWLKTKVVSVYFTFAPSLSALFCVLLKIYYGLFHKV